MDNFPLSIPDLEVSEWEPNRIGESNTIYKISGCYKGKPLTAFVKSCKNASRSLANEYTVLKALASTDIPVPRVLWVSEARDVLLIEAIEGVMIWDLIDSRREHYDKDNVLPVLHSYGEVLGRIHGLPLECPPQIRARLYNLIGEEHVDNPRFREIIAWLEANKVTPQNDVFVHGDFNSANVLYGNGMVSGIVDWEFAGSGWREYELAWVLRARLHFLNSQSQREAFLQGYCQFNSFDPDKLRWCEVMNYLHDAYWSIEVNSAYIDFSTTQALKLIG